MAASEVSGLPFFTRTVELSPIFRRHTEWKGEGGLRFEEIYHACADSVYAWLRVRVRAPGLLDAQQNHKVQQISSET
jgi:hypothetical protein